jgi:hypothetical protein
LAKLKLKEEVRKKEAILEEIKAEEEIARRKKEEEAKAARMLASQVAKSAAPKPSLSGFKVSGLDDDCLLCGALYVWNINIM